MAGTSAGAAKRKRCHCGAFAHFGDCPKHGVEARDLMERLWEQIPQGDPDECWEFTGSRNSAGYGYLVTPDHVHHLAHRLVIGAPADKKVRHACDNPPCCNPNHLSLGTHADNMKDMTDRNRQARGVKHPRAKFTEEQIRAIVFDPRPSKAVAPQYGVADSTIRKIRRGDRWGHVDLLPPPEPALEDWPPSDS